MLFTFLSTCAFSALISASPCMAGPFCVVPSMRRPLARLISCGAGGAGRSGSIRCTRRRSGGLGGTKPVGARWTRNFSRITRAARIVAGVVDSAFICRTVRYATDGRGASSRGAGVGRTHSARRAGGRPAGSTTGRGGGSASGATTRAGAPSATLSKGSNGNEEQGLNHVGKCLLRHRLISFGNQPAELPPVPKIQGACR
jgi:hypothetical protein